MRLHKKLLAGILTFSFSVAQAGPADLILTPFTGDGIVTTDLAAVGNQSSPWTDAFGRTYTLPDGSPGIINGLGLYFVDGNFTISGFGPNVTKVGWYWANFFNASMSNLAFSNGDSYSVLTPLPDPEGFIGFSSNTPFTSVTITITGGGSGYMGDFITQAVVPEPSTIVSSVICALCVGVVSYRKYRVRRLASV